MTAEGYYDIPLEIGGLPSGKTAADFGHHCHLEEAAGDSTQQAAGCKYLGNLYERHNVLTAFRRLFQRSGQRTGLDLLSNVTRGMHQESLVQCPK